MKQESFSDMEYSCRKKKTKREEFLEIMEEIIPWDEWVGIIRPYYPTGERGLVPPLGGQGGIEKGGGGAGGPGGRSRLCN